MARRYPKYWDYNNWEEKKEEKRRQDYLDRQELQKKDKEKQTPDQNKTSEEIIEENKNITSESNTSNMKTGQFAVLKGEQTSFFDYFPDGIVKTESKVKRGRKTNFKKVSEYLIKQQEHDRQQEIINTAYLVPETCFVNKTLDDVISYIELLNEGNDPINVVVEYNGQKFYSLLDNRDSCYKKVYGVDYKAYIENQEAEIEME